MTPATAALVAAVLGAAGAQAPREVSVRILSRAHPSSIEVSRPGEAHLAEATGGALRVDGHAIAGSRAFPDGRWHVGVPGTPGRDLTGSITLSPEGDEVAVVVRMSLEDHVAAVVAAESDEGTPIEALKALAVVARSFALSARGRHPDADLCDLAHCQVMGAASPAGHRAAARAAARATTGRVLLDPAGRVAVATFHASCGGHTADPGEVFGGDPTGAGAVADPDCASSRWESAVPAAILSRVAGEVLSHGSRGGTPVPAEQLRFLRGRGGYVIQVADGTRRAGGESFTRALDRALGYGRIRSARLEVQREGSAFRVTGSGVGHGVGLCQAGATIRSARGEGYESILRHYFPAGRLVGPPPPLTSDRAEPPAPRWAPLSRTSSR